MRIEVRGANGSTTPQARAYAEYRLFATLVRHARLIESVHVVLTCPESSDGAGPILCAVDLVLAPAGSVRARARGRHVFGAIDRAAERIGNLMARRSVPSS